MAHYLLIGAITAVIVGGFSWLMRRARPLRGDASAGAIRPGRISAAITVVLGLAMAAGGVIGLLARSWGLGASLLLMGGAIAGFMAPSLTNVHVVTWDEGGLAGPCRTFGLTLGTARTRIEWDQIARTGKTATGYWYVEAADGRRVFWSYLYPGYGELVEALRRHCPAVELPDDLAPQQA